MSFNPRARVGRDAEGHRTAGDGRVSIHAPAWGATTEAVQKGAEYIVSIHAPAWGATQVGSVTDRTVCLFQSTRPRGARPSISLDEVFFVAFQSTRPRGARRMYGELQEIESKVSIHAPAWGATARKMELQSRDYSFNPRARVGRDPLRAVTSKYML